MFIITDNMYFTSCTRYVGCEDWLTLKNISTTARRFLFVDIRDHLSRLAVCGDTLRVSGHLALVCVSRASGCLIWVCVVSTSQDRNPRLWVYDTLVSSLHVLVNWARRTSNRPIIHITSRQRADHMSSNSLILSEHGHRASGAGLDDQDPWDKRDAAQENQQISHLDQSEKWRADVTSRRLTNRFEHSCWFIFYPPIPAQEITYACNFMIITLIFRRWIRVACNATSACHNDRGLTAIDNIRDVDRLMTPTNALRSEYESITEWIRWGHQMSNNMFPQSTDVVETVQPTMWIHNNVDMMTTSVDRQNTVT